MTNIQINQIVIIVNILFFVDSVKVSARDMPRAPVSAVSSPSSPLSMDYQQRYYQTGGSQNQPPRYTTYCNTAMPDHSSSSFAISFLDTKYKMYLKPKSCMLPRLVRGLFGHFSTFHQNTFLLVFDMVRIRVTPGGWSKQQQLPPTTTTQHNVFQQQQLPSIF